jgi:hypothetical protein
MNIHSELILCFYIPLTCMCWMGSWIPMWRLNNPQTFYFEAKSSVFRPLFTLVCIMPVIVLWLLHFLFLRLRLHELSLRQLIFVDTSNAVTAVGILVFSLWQVPYCVGRNISLSLSALVLGSMFQTAGCVFLFVGKQHVSGALLSAAAGIQIAFAGLNLIIRYNDTSSDKSLSLFQIFKRLGLLPN